MNTGITGMFIGIGMAALAVDCYLKTMQISELRDRILKLEAIAGVFMEMVANPVKAEEHRQMFTKAYTEMNERTNE